ncbi:MULTISPECIES: S41 family peptidase [unclassified Duganella]|uniref:S41 family peptidase n=1 Tax=unclassified Duganella TaxID=2636909 RepID=UPI00087F0591|nr:MULTISPECIES: S41 family peptidase [unclassified Duganella]SDG20726.1 carboxyl-terminal processing protease [Duganella sp. OV458]SDJ27534.1 carboxyl-terminal processing protease [Duganella sp. OV510]
MKLVFPCTLMALAIMTNTAAAPVAAQKDASIWVARVLDRLRYKTEGQPEGANGHPFDRFIEALDSERMVFTQASLANMANQRVQLDKLTSEKQMDTLNGIFSDYLARSVALHTYRQEALRQAPAFHGHEQFQRERSKARWEPDDTALRDLWRRQVMDDYLNLRLAGVSEDQVIPTLQRRYERNLQRVQAMRYGDVADLFLQAYVESYDPHGAYLAPGKTSPEHLLGDMVGIGLTLQKKDDLITVLEVVPGTDADRSGDIAPGDRIIGVAQGIGQPMQEVIGWKVDEVAALLRGAPGSQLVIDILPQGIPRGQVARRIIVTRTKVQLDDQRTKGRIERIARGANNYRIGVITIPTFYQDYTARRAGAKDYLSVSRDVAAAVAQMKQQKADAILLDMRNNGGGSLSEAIELTGLFLPGVPVVQQISSDRRLTVERTPLAAPAWNGPLAVLIDRRSAAATEIIAAAIQDYGRGLVLGDLSYGRGSVQTVLSLDRFSTDSSKAYGDVRLTVAVLCRAGGKPIQRFGVTPDISIPGYVDMTGKANADLYGGANCKTQDIAKSGALDALLPKLNALHTSRMQVARPEGDIAQSQLKEAIAVLSDVAAQARQEPRP